MRYKDTRKPTKYLTQTTSICYPFSLPSGTIKTNCPTVNRIIKSYNLPGSLADEIRIVTNVTPHVTAIGLGTLRYSHEQSLYCVNFYGSRF